MVKKTGLMRRFLWKVYNWLSTKLDDEPRYYIMEGFVQRSSCMSTPRSMLINIKAKNNEEAMKQAREGYSNMQRKEVWRRIGCVE